MIALSTGLSYVDLQFQGVPHAIATVALHGMGGVALIDPGPASTLPTLEASLRHAGIEWRDVRSLLLTHIHLDHAGASGTLVRRNPAMRVYVHEKGAPHLVDPSKLVGSAARLWGDQMNSLWGEVAAVPEANLVILSGGERIEAGGRALDVAYTPGHASHHVSYWSADTGVAFVGDTAGINVRPGGYILPPTPPPDINLEKWRESLRLIGDWRPDTLFITHFGPMPQGGAHLAAFQSRLEEDAALAKRILERAGTEEERERWFVDEVQGRLRQAMGSQDEQAYELIGRLDLSWRGISRYWQKRVA
jgi:glyoxylase-like metal-dependent hydrolase (beta-lactamase superfamily II)